MGQYTQLALRIWNSHGQHPAPGSPQEADLKLFSEFATRMGRLVHKTRMFLKNPEGPDFVAGAFGQLYATLGDFARAYASKQLQGTQGASADPYVAWARTVLTNQYYDNGRKQKRFTENRREVASESVEYPKELVFGGGDGRFCVTAAEVQAMESWDPIDRLVLVCILRCWHVVPAQTWTRWLSEAKLAAPFPPQNFIAAPKGLEREQLGRALNMSRNAIDKRISRMKLVSNT
jgi:hypothetical protein